LKENVIIGKLIPAGTGMARYRNLKARVRGEEQTDGEGAEQEKVLVD
jgi:DNA-directed RNA polymerase subunit beta'